MSSYRRPSIRNPGGWPRDPELDERIPALATKADLDLDAVTGMLTGSPHAHLPAHGRPPPDWPERVIDPLWPAIRAR